jgi:hypothetical protein
MAATHIILSHNGDPYGRGFVGMLADSATADCGVYMGDIGARPRAWWRHYARRNGYKLVEHR